MFKEYFVLLLLAHIMGDFYFQTSNISKKKESSMKWVMIHCFFYWLSTMLILIPIISKNIFIVGTVAAILHAIIDIIKYLYVKEIKRKSEMTIIKDRNIFFVDQVLHIMCIILISYFVVLSNVQFCVYKTVFQFFDIVGFDKITFICWIVPVLLIHKPTNITISKLLTIYKPEGKDEENKKDSNAGRFIGTIERIIILIFISIGQYSAIGLVLTAKSIARYDKISREKDFAEYYLLGTLISTVAVIVVSFLI